MKRLTTNKDLSDIEGMYELAHNSCYIDKDRNTRYRDFEIDIDARVLTRELLKKYADDDIYLDNNDFDCQMMEALQYGLDTRKGLIALFYRNLWAMAELREKLKEYEDAEEQGLLLKLPCKVGDTVYFIENNLINHMKAYRFDIRPMQKFICDDTGKRINFKQLGKTAFLIEEEAEQALAKMKEV